MNHVQVYFGCWGVGVVVKTKKSSEKYGNTFGESLKHRATRAYMFYSWGVIANIKTYFSLHNRLFYVVFMTADV